VTSGANSLPREYTPLDGHEIEILDSLLPNLQPLARQGDKEAAGLVLKILSLRLAYRRQRLAEAD
jgi:hypothetical protein